MGEKCQKLPPPEVEEAVTLTAPPIPCPLCRLGEEGGDRGIGSKAEPAKKGGLGEGVFSMW